MKHLLSIESLSPNDLHSILRRTPRIKRERGAAIYQKTLTGQTWAMIFTKSSTRTRVSFEVGLRELGGEVLFMSGQDLQLGRGEPIRDTARVFARMISGVIIRTGPQAYVEEMAHYLKKPVINALTDDEHPCQIISDLYTISEALETWENKKIAFVGDGTCNVARSWMWAALRLGLKLRIGAPREYLPSTEDQELFKGAVHFTEDPGEAVEDADVVYTDVWVSMGKETESEERIDRLRPYQLNHALLEQASPKVKVLHCLPAYRGMEITEELLEEHADLIFTQAENRLHAQKAILEWVVEEEHRRV
ncbi:MAG: ornithine carbamoyltransferase [Verrucomicrobiales bacterium]